MVKLEVVKVEAPKNCNVILGTAHFIKTVEDLYEAMKNAVPGGKFGIGFCESSGPCLVRFEGNDDELKKLALSRFGAWMRSRIHNSHEGCFSD